MEEGHCTSTAHEPHVSAYGICRVPITLDHYRGVVARASAISRHGRRQAFRPRGAEPCEPWMYAPHGHHRPHSTGMQGASECSRTVLGSCVVCDIL